MSQDSPFSFLNTLHFLSLRTLCIESHFSSQFFRGLSNSNKSSSGTTTLCKRLFTIILHGIGQKIFNQRINLASPVLKHFVTMLPSTEHSRKIVLSFQPLMDEDGNPFPNRNTTIEEPAWVLPTDNPWKNHNNDTLIYQANQDGQGKVYLQPPYSFITTYSLFIREKTLFKTRFYSSQNVFCDHKDVCNDTNLIWFYRGVHRLGRAANSRGSGSEGVLDTRVISTTSEHVIHEGSPETVFSHSPSDLYKSTPTACLQ